MCSNYKFLVESFRQLDLPNLLINIWSYANKPVCPMCNQYQKYCIQAAKEQWLSSFIDLDFVIQNLKRQNKRFFDFGKISSQDRNSIYVVISKYKTLWLVVNKYFFAIFLFVMI